MPLLADAKFPTTLVGARALFAQYETALATLEAELRRRDAAAKRKAARLAAQAESAVVVQNKLLGELAVAHAALRRFAKRYPKHTIKMPALRMSARERARLGLGDDAAAADDSSSSSSSSSSGGGGPPEKRARGRPRKAPAKRKAAPGKKAPGKKKKKPARPEPAGDGDDSAASDALSLDAPSPPFGSRSAIKKSAATAAAAAADDADDEAPAEDEVVKLLSVGLAYELKVYKVAWKSGSQTWEFTLDLKKYGYGKLVAAFDRKNRGAPPVLARDEWPLHAADEHVPGRIVDMAQCENERVFQVHWKGSGDEDNTWERRTDLYGHGHYDLVRAFEAKWPDATPLKTIDLSDPANPVLTNAPESSPAKTATKKTGKAKVGSDQDDEADMVSLSSTAHSSELGASSTSTDGSESESASMLPRDVSAAHNKKQAAMLRKLQNAKPNMVLGPAPDGGTPTKGEKGYSAKTTGSTHRSGSGRRVKPVKRMGLTE